LAVRDFPLTALALDTLGQVAGDEQFEVGLAAICAGLAARAR
jgi:Tetracyclin repressor-like, C-terminal domain